MGSLSESTSSWGTLRYWKVTFWNFHLKWSYSDTFWILQRELKLHSWPNLCVCVLYLDLLNTSDGYLSLWQWQICTQKIFVGIFVILLSLHNNILYFSDSPTLVCDEVWQRTSFTWHLPKPWTTISSWCLHRIPVLWSNLFLLKQHFRGYSILVGYLTPSSLVFITKTFPIFQCTFLHICGYYGILLSLFVPPLCPRCSHRLCLGHYLLLASLWYMWPCRNERHRGLKSKKVVWVHFKPMAPKLNWHNPKLDFT